MNNQLRIIGGDWRSRVIHFVDAEGLRPTPVRVRETLFNWLQQDIVGRRCLDLYAGSGALSFEAASRGASRVMQVEEKPEVCQQLLANAQKLAATQVKVVQQEVLSFLNGTAEMFDVVFIDPPFMQQKIIPTCQLLESQHWLAKNAKIYLETERHLDLQGLPENWRELKHKIAGEVEYRLFVKQI